MEIIKYSKVQYLYVPPDSEVVWNEEGYEVDPVDDGDQVHRQEQSCIRHWDHKSYRKHSLLQYQDKKHWI